MWPLLCLLFSVVPGSGPEPAAPAPAGAAAPAAPAPAAGEGEARQAALARLEKAAAELSAGNLERAGELLLPLEQDLYRLGLVDILAEVTANLGLIDHLRGRFTAAIDRYRQAIAIYRRTGDRAGEAVVLANLAGVHAQLGEAQEALALDQQALALHRSLDNSVGELELLNNLAVLYRQMGENEAALEIYATLVARYRQKNDPGGLGRALNNQGFVYFSVGDLERADRYFAEALELRRAQQDRRGEFATLSNLGNVAYFRDDFAAARAYHQEALALARSLSERSTYGALSLLAQDLAALGEPAALPLFAEALAKATAAADPDRDEIRLRRAQGQLRLGQEAAARAELQELGATFLAQGNHAALALATTSLGQAERKLGHGGAALAAFRQAIDLLEKQRSTLDNPGLRATLLAARRQAFELFALTAVEEAREKKRPELLLEALTALERSRARGLLDLLAEAKLAQGGGPALAGLLEERREVLRRMALLAREEDLARAGKRQGNLADLGRSLEAARVRLEGLESNLRQLDPRLAGLTPAAPAPPATWRPALDAKTRLLHFLLSSEKSLVFVVASDRIEAYPLPPRPELDALARQAAEALASPSRADDALATLAARLLPPILPSLDGVEKLWIVADGGLHQVPLAALPLPPGSGKAGTRLIDRFEIVNIPSGGVLAELLQRPPRHHLERIAIFADPVFAPGRPGPQAEADELLRQLGNSELSPLPGTRLEAEKIAALAPDKVHLALGFAASRGRLEAEAASADVLHFATHGLIDLDHPELSGLALSLFSADGSWQPDGLLHFEDLAALRLDAELVVLSGCRTALGRALDGEGLLGLARGLFYAGSRRVLASLWPVRDRATAELMSRFYRELLAGAPAATALRRAQRELAATAAYRDPFFWAPFVLIGDPR